MIIGSLLVFEKALQNRKNVQPDIIPQMESAKLRNNQLICQLCDHPMPFRLANGEEYFEAYQYTEVLEKEHEANHLALCPNCAAEFQYACQTDENERARLILDLDPAVDEANLIVHLAMPVHRQLRFTQRHLIDLQVAIQNWCKANPECVK